MAPAAVMRYTVYRRRSSRGVGGTFIALVGQKTVDLTSRDLVRIRFDDSNEATFKLSRSGNPTLVSLILDLKDPMNAKLNLNRMLGQQFLRTGQGQAIGEAIKSDHTVLFGELSLTSNLLKKLRPKWKVELEPFRRPR